MTLIISHRSALDTRDQASVQPHRASSSTSFSSSIALSPGNAWGLLCALCGGPQMLLPRDIVEVNDLTARAKINKSLPASRLHKSPLKRRFAGEAPPVANDCFFFPFFLDCSRGSAVTQMSSFPHPLCHTHTLCGHSNLQHVLSGDISWLTGVCCGWGCV